MALDWLPDVSSSKDWRLLGMRDLSKANPSSRIESVEFAMPGAIALISCSSSTARATWRLAGWAQILLEEASFRAIVARETVTLREAALIIAPKSTGQYRLHMDFPIWMPSIQVIAKGFTGDDTRPLDVIHRIEQKIDYVGP